MKRRHILGALAAACLTAGPAVGQPSTFDRARTAMALGQLDEAERLYRSILAGNPKHYYALFNMGLVYDARASRIAAMDQRRKDYLIAASWLEKAYAVRNTVTPPDYTIYNSLGAIYLVLGDLQRAESLLLEGQRYEKELSAASRGKLYGNLGYLYALRGDDKKAFGYLKAGADLKSGFATENLGRLQAMASARPTTAARK